MKARLVSRRLEFGNSSSHSHFCWQTSQPASGTTFGLLIALITLLSILMLSSCGSAGSTSSNTSPFNAANGAGSALTPGPVQSSIGDHGVMLNWNSSIASGAVGYNVYRGDGSGGPYMRLNYSKLPATNYTDSAVQAGQTYYYVVTAINSGNLESDFSKEVVAPIP